MEIAEFLSGLISRDLVISAVLFACLWRVWVKLCAVFDRVTDVLARNASSLNGLRAEIEKCPKRSREHIWQERRAAETPVESVASELYLARAPNSEGG